ncbi:MULTISPECIES: hypothetical protein [Nocardia]|uniref:hypothetical protein n=1 Tax=Nocardia TaxID=1817 RepID=UPI000D68E6BF|nr:MULTISPECIES: hypothetical protein [Nocardia]
MNLPMHVAMGTLCATPLLVFLPAVVGAVGVHAEHRRRHALRQWAANNGWQYAEGLHAPWTARMPGANARGVGVALTRVLDGRRVTVADYHYRTTTNERSTDGTTRTTTRRHHFVVTIVHLDRPHPPIAVVERGTLGILHRSIFGDKPTATGNIWFDNRFWIASRDPGYVRHLVGPDLIDAHIAGAVPLWSVAGNDLMTYSVGHLNRVRAIPEHITPLLRVANLLGRTDAWST